ncbi:peptide-methionine (S)-S-oxide reductase MsrA [Novosphingobium profundi]|uniref:peptide-methionine (S)-S-oxide reductase MsrA n=1 Tax=Novosphingobium profundi TaxID=1774954 RepID=UPI001BDA172F|nr:peptide-methionine (S)-S-oxide reductase MsrA [Novosphingobium profundi]MBT0667119.1 peptide-methionine (S)-S-oxide reductase MsrA [Novosphingobium profundi]
MRDNRPRRFTRLAGALGAATLCAAGFLVSDLSAPPQAQARDIPSARVTEAAPRGMQTAVFAGGCFWGIEAVFEHVRGVKTVTTGYAGGTRQSANYADVSRERTRHAEAVRIVYDPAHVRYAQLLEVFFAVAHDPTQVNRQTPDIGPSYRSAIFPQTEQQRRIAHDYIAQLDAAKAFPRPIATKLENGMFFPAEDYHQDFARKNPRNAYIVRWDAPKVAHLKASFPKLYRP